MADIPMPFWSAVSFLRICFFVPQTLQDEAHCSLGAFFLYHLHCLHCLCCSNHLEYNLDHFHNYLPEYGTVKRSYRSNRAISEP